MRVTPAFHFFVAIFLVLTSSGHTGAQPDGSAGRTTCTVKIADNDVPLVFGDQSLSEDLKVRIAEDIQSCLSRNVSVVLRSRKPSLVKPWQGHPVTHKLSEVKNGKFYQLHSTELPDMMREHFGGAAMIDSVPHLIVNQKLIAAYTSSVEALDQHPRMMGDLKEFLDLLQNPVELKKIAREQKQAEEFVYCYRVSRDTGLSLLQAYVRDLSAGHTLKIRQPLSLLEIVSLRRGFEDEDAPEDVYIVSVVVSGQKTPESEPFTERLPLGAYANGKWRLFAWPMP